MPQLDYAGNEWVDIENFTIGGNGKISTKEECLGQENKTAWMMIYKEN